MRFLRSLSSHTKAIVGHTRGGFPGFSTTMNVGSPPRTGCKSSKGFPRLPIYASAWVEEVQV